MQSKQVSRVIVVSGVLLTLASVALSYSAKHVDPPPPGKTKEDQRRNHDGEDDQRDSDVRVHTVFTFSTTDRAVGMRKTSKRG